MAKDYYQTLGVNKSATKEEIKKAYKKLAKQYHPDLNKEKDAEHKFKEINEAAAVLGDDKKREQYDRFGTADPPGFGRGHGGFSGTDFSNFGFNFDDIFDMFSGGFGGKGGFGGGHGGRRGRRGSDLQYEMEIELEDAAFGTEKNIVIPINIVCSKCKGSGAESDSSVKTCSTCGGSGRIQRTSRTPFGMFTQASTCGDCGGEGKVIHNPCETCDGEGRIEKESKIEVKIPAGVHDSTQLRLSGKGEAGYQGAPSGDLYIVIRIREHKIFERKGNDIYCSVPISITNAILGADIDVPTLKGSAELDIPEGTQSHTLFKMAGKGLPDLHGRGKGDEYVRVVVETPKKLSKKQREIIKEFDNTLEKKEGLFSKILGG